MAAMPGMLKKTGEFLGRYLRSMIAVTVMLTGMLVWFAGPEIGMKSSESRLAVILGIVFLWGASLFVEQVRDRKRAQLLERSLQHQAREHIISTRPDRKAQLEAIQAEFEKAIAALKESKLGQGRAGKSALYALPWYILIGPPGSGKSTAVLNSSLQFAYVGESGRGVRGVGGTRNCDWWFTNEAVLLDTAGRHMHEDEDKEEWLSFLGLLKQYRQETPINGVVIVVSLPELLTANEEDLEWQAQQIRARLDELVTRLGIIFPVYVVFSKADLIHGFIDTFGKLDRTELAALWGHTFPKQSGPEPPRKRFEEAFEALLQGLEARRAWTTVSLGGTTARTLFAFPMQLRARAANLGKFVEVLFQPSPYHEDPLFRGFYITSGTQEGVPVDLALSQINGAAELPSVSGVPFDPQMEKRAYFIRGVFADVIFPDWSLAGYTSAVRTRHLYLKRAWYASVALTALSLVGIFSMSFARNKQWLAALAGAAKESHASVAADTGSLPDHILGLEPYRREVALLTDYHTHGVSWHLSGGMYAGAFVYEPATTLYFRLFNRVYAPQTQASIEGKLRGLTLGTAKFSAEEDADYFYSLLKLYLMLGTVQHFQPDFAKVWLPRVWMREVAPLVPTIARQPEFGDLMPAQADLYARSVSAERVPFAAIDDTLVSRMRAKLKEIPLTQLVYERLRRDAVHRKEQITLNDLLKQGSKEDTITTLFSSSWAVPTLYTKEGSRKQLPVALERTVKDAQQDAWVLDVGDVDVKKLRVDVEALYFEDYAQHWLKFMSALKLAPFEDNIKQLDLLTNKPSPITDLFEKIDEHTYLDPFSSDIRRNVENFFPRGVLPSGPAHPISLRFRSFHDFIYTPAGEAKETPLELYLKEVEKIRDVMKAQKLDGVQQTLEPMLRIQAQKTAERLMQKLSPEVLHALNDFLLEPFVGAMIIDLKAINAKMKAEVYEPCMQSINGRYPFRKGGPGRDEVTMAELQDFFHPQNGLFWKFFHDNLERYFVNEGGVWKPTRTTMGVGLPASSPFTDTLNAASNISDGFFPNGSQEPRVTFELRPQPTSGVSQIKLDIDGETMVYRNEPEELSNHRFTWQGSAGGSAFLQVQVGMPGQYKHYMKQFDGRWALFRLLDTARVTQLRSTDYRLEWEFRDDAGQPLKIQMELRADSLHNAFAPILMSRFHCPSEVAR